MSLATTAHAEPLLLTLRKQTEVAPQTGRYHTLETPTQWDPRTTAIVVCDMWDTHTCPNAARRVGEMAPRMNAVLHAARQQGVFIIHCPSDTMKFYADHPGRKLAQAAPVVEPPRKLERWCKIDPAHEPPLPIDDSDGGCDCERTWKPGQPYPWTRQHAALEIVDGDAITDSAEAYYLLRQRQIKNVLVMGVHTNMCVLGRPFSIRQLVYQGLNVALVRDLTDTMYNPLMRPYVSHFSGTDLVVQHIERHWCPTVLSGDLLATSAVGRTQFPAREFRFPGDDRPHVALVIAEDEYQTERTLPEFAEKTLRKDFRLSYVFQKEGQKHDLPGLELLAEADVLLLSVRRRPLPREQLEHVRRLIAAGKSVVGIRTANHAFSLRNQPEPPAGLDHWPTLDRDVFGGNYSNHHGNHLRTWSWPVAGTSHPILNGIPSGEWPVGGSLYVVSPLAPGTTELLRGRTEGISQQEPVAWVFQRPDGGRSFYTSLGHPENFSLPAFQQLLWNAVRWAAEKPPEKPSDGRTTQAATTDQRASVAAQDGGPPVGWTKLQVPGTWDSQRDDLKPYDGFAWYRCAVAPPQQWKGRGLFLYVEKVDNACETYFNGVKVGVSGTLPPQYVSGLATNEHRYVIPAEIVRWDRPNEVAIRVYDHDGAGGFKGRAPHLLGGPEAIALDGPWQFRTGDDLAWAQGLDLSAEGRDPVTGEAPFAKTGPLPKLSPFATVIRRQAQDRPLSPQESLSQFQTPDDLQIELVLSEPEITQPLFLNFDERGRLWVLEYRQYPEPAGLKLLSKDQYWRAVYDRVPEPPPHGPKGRDRISIHEDRDGNGTFETHKVFLDGLNIATSFAQGRGGVYVLNPPYLLFYPDRNRDDIPDSDPQVLLSGFGLEDTHSVVNSLRWGPDHWLYGAQGSTVTANVKRPGDTKGVTTIGQNLWRYHPQTKRFEVFAEGGGNAFGVEIDASGRFFSGHNGGNTRGFHYHPFSYLQKGFNKHGPLSNPYAFGYFPMMAHADDTRFTHTFVVYEGDRLPETYHGKLLACNPMTNRILISERIAVGSTFRTVDRPEHITTTDRWFRPVDIKDGPDGCLYVADWYDGQLAHTANYQGGIDQAHGRIYRIQPATGWKPREQYPPANEPEPLPEDWQTASGNQLAELLLHPNRWHRQTAARVLADRNDIECRNALVRRLGGEDLSQFTIDRFWAAQGLGILEKDNHVLRQMLRPEVIPDPQTRAWYLMLEADDGQFGPLEFPAVIEIAASDPAVEVVCALAAYSQRLTAEQAIPILEKLLRRSEFVADARFPLLVWWGLEKHLSAAASRSTVLALFDDRTLWREPLVEKEMLSRLMRRFAATGQQADLAVCLRLLKTAPDQAATHALVRGFEDGTQGRTLTGLPAELAAALRAAGSGSLSLALRQGDADAWSKALKTLADEKGAIGPRLEIARLCGELPRHEAWPVLLAVLEATRDDGLAAAVLGALPAYDAPPIATTILRLYPERTEDWRIAAQGLLASRLGTARALVTAVDEGTLDRRSIPLETVRRLTLFKDAALQKTIARLWGPIEGGSTAAAQAELERLAEALKGAVPGDPYIGKALYQQHCGKCHQLHAQGGQIGPDLTSFPRDNVTRLLQNIVLPSAEIREGYETHVVVMADGRVVQGFRVDEDPQTLVLRTAEGTTVSLSRGAIEEQSVSKVSLMPGGLLSAASADEIRHLFAYLRSSQPLAN